MSNARWLMCLAVLLGSACGDDGASPSADATAVQADAATALTWTNFAESFMQTYCQACHGPGDALRDFSQLSMVRAESDSIRCGVSATTLAGCTIPARQFPVGNGPKPSDAERAQLVEWLDSGAIE